MLCGYAIDSRARPGEQGPVSCGLKRCKDLGIQLPQISNSVETLPCSSGQLLMEIVAIAFPISHPITSRIYKNEVYNILMYILFMYIHILVSFQVQSSNQQSVTHHPAFRKNWPILLNLVNRIIFQKNRTRWKSIFLHIQRFSTSPSNPSLLIKQKKPSKTHARSVSHIVSRGTMFRIATVEWPSVDWAPRVSGQHPTPISGRWVDSLPHLCWWTNYS